MRPRRKNRVDNIETCPPGADTPKRTSLLGCTKGLSSVEYVILMVFIAVIGITAWDSFGKTIKDKIQKADEEIAAGGGSEDDG